MNDKSDQVVVGNYVVGTIDILNQRDKLRAWNRPQNNDEMQQFALLLKETWGRVKQFREELRNALTHFRQETDRIMREELRHLYEKLSSDQKRLLQQGQQHELELMHYSDTIILFSRLFDLKNQPQMAGFNAFLAALGVAMLGALARGVAIRGAVEVGLGVPLPEGDIYGPAIVSAHDLESEKAQYPRIVIGPEAMEYLDFLEKHAGSNYFHQVAKAVGEDCRKLIVTDPFDNCPVIDYLGPGFAALIDKQPVELFSSALAFVEAQCEEFAKTKNHKLASRYEQLRSYFERNRANWS